MSKLSINIQEQLALRIDQGVSQQLDDVVLKVRTISKKFKIEKVNERSPIKNVVTAATEPITSLEVIKNFIRYQAGRKNASEIWKLKDPGDTNSLFADEVVNNLNSLANNCKAILDTLEASISKNLEAEDISEVEIERLKALDQYLQANKGMILQSTHLRLARLYLGYLSREHTALVKKD